MQSDWRRSISLAGNGNVNQAGLIKRMEILLQRRNEEG